MTGVPREVGDGRYRLGDALGRGATGTVYAGTAADGEQVAVKILHEHLSAVPELVTRFRREAKIAGSISSPHVAPVLAAGRTPQGLYWIAYRRLNGETLDACLRRDGVMHVSRAAVVLDHVLLGLGVAHQAGIVHRDIKPGNIFLERVPGGSRACVLDFGSSKYRPPPGSATSQHLTTASETLGTINYMPPEQFGGSAAVDARADLYAAGVVAFKLLTGTLPFMAESRGAIMLAKRNGVPLTLAQVSGGAVWPAAIEGFFVTALAREPERRFANAEAMRSAWGHSVAGVALPVVTGARAAEMQQKEDTTVDDLLAGLVG
jgi:serine/threonine-protein kinase